LVVRRPRVGTVVAPLDLREIENAFQVRHMLEARTAALAAEKASEVDLVAITSAFDGAEAAIAAGDVRAMLVMDRNFHKAVAAATQNPTLARFVVSLQNVATRFWIWAMERQSPDDRDAAAAEAAAAHLVGDPPSAYR
jgi:DNA-binding GntR family transcriptional regulator